MDLNNKQKSYVDVDTVEIQHDFHEESKGAKQQGHDLFGGFLSKDKFDKLRETAVDAHAKVISEVAKQVKEKTKIAVPQ